MPRRSNCCIPTFEAPTGFRLFSRYFPQTTRNAVPINASESDLKKRAPSFLRPPHCNNFANCASLAITTRWNASKPPAATRRCTASCSHASLSPSSGSPHYVSLLLNAERLREFAGNCEQSRIKSGKMRSRSKINFPAQASREG